MWWAPLAAPKARRRAWWAGRGRETDHDGVSGLASPDQGGPGTLRPKALLALPTRFVAGADCLLAPRAQRAHGTSGDGDGLFGCV